MAQRTATVRLDADTARRQRTGREAGGEQSSGIGQIGHAVTQLDPVTQQNAAPVEESAAAAEGLRPRADALAKALATSRP